MDYGLGGFSDQILSDMADSIQMEIDSFANSSDVGTMNMVRSRMMSKFTVDGFLTSCFQDGDVPHTSEDTVDEDSESEKTKKIINKLIETAGKVGNSRETLEARHGGRVPFHYAAMLGNDAFIPLLNAMTEAALDINVQYIVCSYM